MADDPPQCWPSWAVGDLADTRTNGERVIALANGHKIVSGWIDYDDPDPLPHGDYLAVEDASHRQYFLLGDLLILSRALATGGLRTSFASSIWRTI